MGWYLTCWCWFLPLVDDRFEGMLLPMFVHTLMSTTGSGVVGPMIMRDPPLFLNNDLLVTCIMAFFLISVVFDPYVVNFIKTVRAGFVLFVALRSYLFLTYCHSRQNIELVAELISRTLCWHCLLCIFVGFCILLTWTALTGYPTGQ